ncbi:hypothetical protein D0Y65_035177 [Glycine soja]|uniref:Uncharacterized protein n=1 Tax=Glycine soja TaxID=3848 RepID=A0A445HU50_GLYSO|nr:hypothetical protein D0Y65_035177 [Glycine soja]
MRTAAVKGTVSDGVVDFLFKMLGDGFEFDKNKIHDVFGRCGYDVQKGHFFNRKVLEADQKSSQKLFRIKESDDDEMSLDLHEHEPKQALPLLKFHLTTLAFLVGTRQ